MDDILMWFGQDIRGVIQMTEDRIRCGENSWLTPKVLPTTGHEEEDEVDLPVRISSPELIMLSSSNIN